jgi:hypothetical protein
MVIGMYFKFDKITATEVAVLEAVQIFIITGLKLIKNKKQFFPNLVLRRLFLSAT